MNEIHQMLFGLCAGVGGTMSVRQLCVLAKLQGVPTMDFGALARDLVLPKAVLSRAVDRLHEQALVAKATPPEDQRKVLISLTPRGRKFCAKHFGGVA